jgi:hypothetical protein
MKQGVLGLELESCTKREEEVEQELHETSDGF